MWQCAKRMSRHLTVGYTSPERLIDILSTVKNDDVTYPLQKIAIDMNRKKIYLL